MHVWATLLGVSRLGRLSVRSAGADDMAWWWLLTRRSAWFPFARRVMILEDRFGKLSWQQRTSCAKTLAPFVFACDRTIDFSRSGLSLRVKRHRDGGVPHCPRASPGSP